MPAGLGARLSLRMIDTEEEDVFVDDAVTGTGGDVDDVVVCDPGGDDEAASSCWLSARLPRSSGSAAPFVAGVTAAPESSAVGVSGTTAVADTDCSDDDNAEDAALVVLVVEEEEVVVVEGDDDDDEDELETSLFASLTASLFGGDLTW